LDDHLLLEAENLQLSTLLKSTLSLLSSSLLKISHGMATVLLAFFEEVIFPNVTSMAAILLQAGPHIWWQSPCPGGSARPHPRQGQQRGGGGCWVASEVVLEHEGLNLFNQQRDDLSRLQNVLFFNMTEQLESIR
jgi:hypothetical protein